MQKYVLPALDLPADALEPLVPRATLEAHHGVHHRAHVTGAMDALVELSRARSRGELGEIERMERELAAHVTGHVLHSVLWRGLAATPDTEPTGQLADTIDEQFGTFAGLRNQMHEAATRVDGPGWVTLSWEPLGRRLVVTRVLEHGGGLTPGAPPLVVLDLWPHAWEGADREAWLEASWRHLDWAGVADRLVTLRETTLCL